MFINSKVVRYNKAIVDLKEKIRLHRQILGKSGRTNYSFFIEHIKDSNNFEALLFQQFI